MIKFYFGISGLQLCASKRFLSDTRSFVQTDRVDSEFLHTFGRDDTYIHVDRPTLGSEEAKSPDRHLFAQFKSK